VLFETLCFHAQQAAEKSIKAVLLHKGIRFPYTHNISRLTDLLNESRIPWPEELGRASKLTDYAMETRYPGPLEEVTEEEYRQAVEIAQRVLEWAEHAIAESSSGA
jgi:HEPN domain-containing protein